MFIQTKLMTKKKTNKSIQQIFRLMKTLTQPWTTFTEILKAILHQKAHTSLLKMFVIYPNIIQKFAIKDRMVFIKIVKPKKKKN